MKLYELTAQAQELYDSLIDADLSDEERDAIISDTMLGMDANEKIESYCKIIRMYEADENACAEEIKRLTEAKKLRAAVVERLKNSVLDYVVASGSTKPIEAGIFRVSKRKSTSVNITDQDGLPPLFVNITFSPDKAKIKDALKNGETVPGAELVENYSLSIR